MKCQAGAILSLIGGIFEILFAVGILLIGIITLGWGALAGLLSSSGSGFLIRFLTGAFWAGLYFIFGIAYLTFGIFMMVCSGWMKRDESTMKGGVTALIMGILAWNIFALIGGILGII